MLFESRAIARYIEAKYPTQGTPLVPTEPKANALFEQAASIETADFDPSASGLTFEKAFKRYGILCVRIQITLTSLIIFKLPRLGNGQSPRQGAH